MSDSDSSSCCKFLGNDGSRPSPRMPRDAYVSVRILEENQSKIAHFMFNSERVPQNPPVVDPVDCQDDSDDAESIPPGEEELWPDLSPHASPVRIEVPSEHSKIIDSPPNTDWQDDENWEPPAEKRNKQQTGKQTEQNLINPQADLFEESNANSIIIEEPVPAIATLSVNEYDDGMAGQEFPQSAVPETQQSPLNISQEMSQEPVGEIATSPVNEHDARVTSHQLPLSKAQDRPGSSINVPKRRNIAHAKMQLRKTLPTMKAAETRNLRSATMLDKEKASRKGTRTRKQVQFYGSPIGNSEIDNLSEEEQCRQSTRAYVTNLKYAEQAAQEGVEKIVVQNSFYGTRVTPTIYTFEKIRKALPRVHLMAAVGVGCRPSDRETFWQCEITKLQARMRTLWRAGARGFTLGCRLKNGEVDTDAVRALANVVGCQNITFNMAIDNVPDKFKSLKELRDLGVTSVLTDGDRADDERILKMGITPLHLIKIKKRTNAGFEEDVSLTFKRIMK